MGRRAFTPALMYVGHVGIALGVKGWKQTIPLWALVLAAQGPDWIDTALAPTCLGGDRAAMWSHSLPSVFICAAAVGLLARVRWQSAVVAWTVSSTYLSHIVADYITGRKPLVPGAPLFGLSLYDRPQWDFVLELTVIAIGWSLWRTSLSREQRNRPAAWLMLAGLIAIQLAADFALSIREANARIF